MSEKASIKIKTMRDELMNIANFVEDIGNRQDWPLDLVFRINLVLEELGLNIIDYAHDDGGVHEFDISLTSGEKEITIEVVDDGKAFDPLSDAPKVDIESNLEDRRVGGLGLHLVRTTVDDMSYRRENGKNHLTLVARRT